MLFVQNEKCSKRGIRTKDTKGSENKKSPANNKCWVGGGEKKKMENSRYTHKQSSVHDWIPLLWASFIFHLVRLPLLGKLSSHVLYLGWIQTNPSCYSTCEHRSVAAGRMYPPWRLMMSWMSLKLLVLGWKPHPSGEGEKYVKNLISPAENFFIISRVENYFPLLLREQKVMRKILLLSCSDVIWFVSLSGLKTSKKSILLSFFFFFSSSFSGELLEEMLKRFGAKQNT